jgi:hypothetical protein
LIGVLLTAGADAATLTLYDNASAASGTVLATLKAAQILRLCGHRQRGIRFQVAVMRILREPAHPLMWCMCNANHAGISVKGRPSFESR